MGVRGLSIHKSGKDSKPLDRSGPHLTYVCRFICEWTSAKKRFTSRAPGGIWSGLEGSHIQQMWERCQTSGPIGTKFGTRMHINLGMEMSSKLTPGYPREWGVRESSIYKSGKASKRLGRSGPNLAHVYRFISEWTLAKKK